MKLGMIWAQSSNGVIGRDGDMPWHLPEDLQHFKATTLGAPVIMGRRTWQSLPDRARPLPGRANIVITRNDRFTAEGATVVQSLQAAITAAETLGHDAAWVIGGGELYRTAMPDADTLVVTVIDTIVNDGDTVAPEIGSDWQRVKLGEPQTSKTGLAFRFDRWQRIRERPEHLESGTLKQ